MQRFDTPIEQMEEMRVCNASAKFFVSSGDIHKCEAVAEFHAGVKGLTQVPLTVLFDSLSPACSSLDGPLADTTTSKPTNETFAILFPGE